MTLPVNVALVDDTGQLDHQELAAVAGALNEQILGDVAAYWRHVHATVVATQYPGPVQWAVRIREQLDEPGALGYHTTDEHNQPVSYVMLTSDWTVTASHEVLEMLIDPSGNRPHSARLPWGLEDLYRDFGLPSPHHHVHYLVEACDPCEAEAYEVGGVQLSDFLLPSWYRTSPRASDAYSFRGFCSYPRQVAEGGYVSFARDDGEWFQVFNRHGRLSHQDLGRFDKAQFSSLREFTDHHARRWRASS